MSNTKTEQEARELWCPMVRHGADDASTFNRGRKNPTNDHEFNDGTLCNCVASQCAMWRWLPITNTENGAMRFVKAQNENAEAEHEAGPIPAGLPDSWRFSTCDGDPAGWVEPIDEALKRRRGYCGLAGTPGGAE